MSLTAERLAAGSIAVGLVVFALKLAAWALTGSVALLSDAIESVVNIVTALAALLAIRFAAQPADDRHPFGHHKVEYLAAVLVGALILTAAVSILVAAWEAWRAPKLVAAPWAGVAVNLAASLLNGVWSLLLIRRGRALRSPALVADGRHLQADVVSSVGVAAGLAAAALSGLPWLDPLLACLVAVGILWSGARLMGESLGGLMDEAAAPSVRAAIDEAIARSGGGAIQAHDVVTRAAASATFVQFHLVVPAELTVGEAHAICDSIEDAIRAAVPGARVTIHVEPPDKAKDDGVVAIRGG